jgi:uncharacterized membrane protein YuzA (DUF378 family)
MKVNLCATTTFRGAIKETLPSANVINFPVPALSTDNMEVINKNVNKVFKFTLPATTAVAFLKATATKAMASTTVLATAGHVDFFKRLLPLIHVIQDFALPVGIIVSTWGMIEFMIGNPGGKQKIKYSILGFAGIYLIPFIFVTLRDTLGGLF